MVLNKIGRGSYLYERYFCATFYGSWLFNITHAGSLVSKMQKMINKIPFFIKSILLNPKGLLFVYKCYR